MRKLDNHSSYRFSWESLKIPKGYSEVVNHRTGNTTAKGEPVIYKAIHRKPIIEQHEPH